MNDRSYKKYRDPLELFLDDGFSNREVAAKLRAAGYVVHEFADSFPREDSPSKREQSVKDPPIIELCHKNSWLLVTTDKEMCKLHFSVIKRNPKVTILATAHNGLCLPHEWVGGLIALQADLQRMFKKCPRPWFATFNRQGRITSTRDFLSGK